MNTVANSTPVVVSSPHAHGGASVSRVMRRVWLALLPATLFGFWCFGWPAVFLFLITVGTSMVAERICVRMMGRRSTLGDGSAVLTGWLLALSLPPWAPWWVGVLGGLVAIVIGKQVFGGIGQNLFNPAMVARVVLLISFPVVMTQWVVTAPMGSPQAPGFVEGLRITLASSQTPDAMASATLLGHVKAEMSRGVDLSHSLSGEKSPQLSLNGLRAGSAGETASLLLLAGGIYLLLTGVISWHIPVTVLLGVVIPAAIGHAVDPARYLSVSAHVLAGATVLGAFFIATDYVTSPNTSLGQLIFGLSLGFLTWVIRSYGGYPEGMAFAVLLMNAMTPVIDRYCRPRILGRTRAGRDLEPETQGVKS